MGIVIHFEGSLLGEGAYEPTVAIVTNFARARGWPCKELAREHAKLKRTSGEKSWDYIGPTKGIELQPHPNSETLRFEFDDQLYVQDYVKTQFAPIEVHIAIVELLKRLQPEFRELRVNDDGEFFDTGDPRHLARHRDSVFKVLKDMLARHPNTIGPVRGPDGRILDIMQKD